MEENITNVPQPRPTVITVFGILTFIGCGLGLLGVLINLMSKNPDLPPPNAGLLLISAVAMIGKIYGVIRMFRMEKTGLYIYTGCEILHVGLGIISTQQNTEAMERFIMESGVEIDTQTLVLGSIIFTLVFSIIFIGAYASQVSKMK